MEAGECPWQTARREIKEELGLDLAPGRLLAVDWVPPGGDGRPALATGTTAYLQHGWHPTHPDN